MSSVLDQEELKAKSLDELIVSGSTLSAIYHMSWPMLVQMLIISAASFSDVFVAGKLGSETQAAIGICNQVWFLMVLMTIALSSGTMALISRFWGARDYDSAIEAGRQSLIFAFIFGTISTVLGLLAAKPLLALTGTTDAVQALGWRFLKVDLMSQLPFTMVWTCHSMFRAIGNSRAPMLIWLAMAIIIISLNFGLCLGPTHMGIEGIALSWVVAGCVGVALNLYLLRSSDLKDSLIVGPAIREGFSPRTREWIWRILKVGIPTCIQDLAWVLGNFAMFKIFAMTQYPTACQAAWTIGFRLEEMICTLPLHALGASIGTIVGQNLGAKKPERAVKTGWQATVIGLVLELPTALAMYVFAQPIASMMTSDPQVLASTADYLRIVGLSEPLVACWIILFGALTGAGYTKWPMWIGIVGLTCVRLPLAYVLATTCHMGADGIWLAIAISSSLIGLMAIQRFHSGVWKSQQV
ncbi:MAG: MATE family efflux transporter [Cyanobacteria bacterium SZAS LIN-3]|nr:MATE family efflux transporter [Cyanobacteria bacterium SZAS LIN-3]